MKVFLRCPICGNDQFESNYDDVDLDIDPEDALYQCSDCGTVFTRDDLMDDNRLLINLAIEDVKKEAVQEIEKEIKKALKKWI